MQQHPVPQNITSYQFRLIGDMTLKQFLELVGGGGVAFLFYMSNLPQFLKLPLMIFSIITGIGFAFMPVEERPLDRWVIAFLKAAYRPLKFIWKKNQSLPDYFTHHSSVAPVVAPPPVPTKSPPTLHQPLPPTPTPNKEEDNRLKSILELFSTTPNTTQLVDSSDQTNHLLEPEPQNRRSEQIWSQVSDQTVEGPQPTNTPNLLGNFDLPNKPTESNTPTPKPSIRPTTIRLTPVEPVKIPHNPKPEPNPTQPTNSPNQPNHFSNLEAQNQRDALPNDSQKPGTTEPISPTTPTTPDTSVPATLSNNLPFPSVPNYPNVLVGMVLDSQGKLVENAIIEMKDSQGMPVRATKTNKLGQFFSTTPLKNGQYTITIEKNHLIFDSISLNLEGKIYPPLEIRAKNALTNTNPTN